MELVEVFARVVSLAGIEQAVDEEQRLAPFGSSR